MICYTTCGWLTVKCCKGFFQIWQTFNFTYSHLIKVATSTWASHYNKPSNVHMYIHIYYCYYIYLQWYTTQGKTFEGKSFAIREKWSFMGNPSQWYACILILPINMTTDSQDNICCRVSNYENRACFLPCKFFLIW